VSRTACASAVTYDKSDLIATVDEIAAVFCQ
jgi:hypothetical protein